MTDSTLNSFIAAGTNAERLAFTPSPPTPASGPDQGYIWFETDTGDTYAWKESAGAWVQVNTATSSASFSGCRVYNDGTQSIPSATSTALTFNTEIYDTDAIHSTASNTSRLTFPYAGKWRITFTINTPSASSTFFVAFLRKNGGTDTNNLPGSAVRSTGATISLSNTVTGNFAVNDYVELFVFQSSGSARNVGSAATSPGDVCAIEAEYLGA